MLVKDALSKIVYKATIMTYEQSMCSSGRCMDEGYSSDLKNSLFADCELEHIAYDTHRKRPALTVTKEDLKEVVIKSSIEDLKNFLIYHHGYHFYKKEKDETIRKFSCQLIDKY